MSKKNTLNILYYLTSGIKHTRLYEGKPFYINYTLKSKLKTFTIDLIKKIISEDQIDISIIDDYRYYSKNKKGFIKIKELISYPLDLNEILILQIHFGIEINPDLLDMQSEYSKMKSNLKELEEKKNFYKNRRNENIDLYFLYASPIVNEDNEEEYKAINYRSEIKKLINIFEKTKQEYNCFFECANDKKLKDTIIKQPKILHISSHGLSNENKEYSLFLEEKGVLQKIHQKRLEEILQSVSNQLKKIDLVFASTCYSEKLGKLFLDNGINNVIYIQGMTPVSDKAAVKFSEYFYSELIKGNNIYDAFYKSKQLVELDKEKDKFQLKKCCCTHWHNKKVCPLKKNEKKFHNLYHIKKCECDYEEYNIHEENCAFIENIKDNKGEKNFYFEKYINNTVKICCICCKPSNDKNNEKMLPHGESFKFILKQKIPGEKKVIFRFKKEGKLNKNNNIYIMNTRDIFNNFSIVGRRKQIKEIYDIIDDEKVNNIHFIILHGTYEVGKQNFAESLCIYLFERKIINGFSNIEIKESKEELYNRVMDLTHNGQNSDGKYIVVVKINYYLDKPIELVNDILNDNRILNPNFYYIILLITQTDKIDYLIHSQEKCKIIYLMNLNQTSAIQLLVDLCDSYGYSMNLKKLNDEDKIKDLIELTGYSRKQINELAELIGIYNDYEKIKAIMQSEELFNGNINIQNEIRLMLDKDISRIYCLLSIMSFGLPESMLKLFEPNFKEIINEEDEENLIANEPNYNWYTIIENRYKKEIFEITDDKKKECIIKCLEIYAQLLFYFIKKTREEIYSHDSNIHYNFNSYNNKGIWKSFDYKIYELYFLTEDKSKVYNNIIEKDFILERHSENIYNLIDKNINFIKIIILNDNNVEQKEYLNQILLMLSSISKINLNKCINLCAKLEMNIKNIFLNSKQRLNLYLLSLRKNIEENNFDFNLLGDQGNADAFFIIGLKQKNIQSFLKSIDLYEKINDNEIKKQISYAYYEIGRIYFKEKKYESAREYLEKGIKASEKYNDNFIKDKIYIELALVLEEETHDKEKYEFYLKKVVNDSGNLSLINEANNILNKFSQKLEPDIIMLNSNPLIKYDNFSVLHNGIWANQNNQFYILQNIDKNLKRDIRVKSIVLNEYNLKEAFNENGKILIIQSDDFNREGDIILESNIGMGELLPKDRLKDILPIKFNYEIVILCFIKSEKLIDYFKGKVKYLITFDDINLETIDFDMLLKYNELSIEFIIHFIINATCSNINKSYEDSLKIFKTKLENYKKSKLELINKNANYITLNVFEEDDNPTVIIQQKDNYNNNKNGGDITYVYPLLEPKDIELHYTIYSDDILKLIKIIFSSRKQIINIYSKFDEQIKIGKYQLNIKTIISFEIMRFIYRHQGFNGKIFYVSKPKKYDDSIQKITNSLISENKVNKNQNKKSIIIENINIAFIVINNYDKIQKRNEENIYLDDLPEHFQYLIISKKPIGKNNKIFSYEIQLAKEEIKNNKEDRGRKNNKDKNQNKDSNSYEYTPNSKTIGGISPLKKKKYSENKNQENNNEIKSTSEFSIIEKNSSSSDSNQSNSDINEYSEHSDFEYDF